MTALLQATMAPATILAAGGCLPVSAQHATTESDTDTLVARTFRHPALGDRVVVQLVPSLQLAGLDAELETLGFSATAEPSTVGVVRRRALGFPGWALVHDPKRARYALEILRQFKKAAARAATKPGHARDEFNAIAERLGREVPHFLPSYWQEAARAFLAAGSPALAASAFDKARQAEAHHALQVDERERSTAFLEFALSGAIAVKSLAAYAKDLERQHGAAAAYPVYRDLCVRAVRGGVPPWAAMAADLRKLAKGAGIAADLADRELVRALVGASSLGRAPAEFWKATRKGWVAEGRADHGVRDALLAAWPQWLDDDNEFLALWLAMLADSGCLEQMAASKARAQEPLGGPAGWLSRLLQKCDDPPTAVFG